MKSPVCSLSANRASGPLVNAETGRYRDPARARRVQPARSCAPQSSALVDYNVYFGQEVHVTRKYAALRASARRARAGTCTCVGSEPNEHVRCATRARAARSSARPGFLSPEPRLARADGRVVGGGGSGPCEALSVPGTHDGFPLPRQQAPGPLHQGTDPRSFFSPGTRL